MLKKQLLFLVLVSIAYGDSLKELINYTYLNNKLLASKELSVKAKEQEVKSSKSNYMPVVDVGAFYQSLNKKTMLISGDIYSSYAKISYNIYDGNKKFFTTKQKEAELTSSRFKSIAFKKSLTLQVVQDFFTIKNIDASMQALQETQTALDAQLIRVKKFYEVDLSTKDDVDKLQSAYDTNQYNIESLKFQKLSIMKNLNLIVGKKINDLEDAIFIKNIPLKLEVNDDIKSLTNKKDSLKNLAFYLAGAYLPQVNISDTFNLNGYARTDILHPAGVDDQNKLMITLNLRLYDAGAVSKTKQATIINTQALGKQIEYEKEKQDMLFNLSISRIKTNKLKIKSALSALKSAKSAYKTIEQKYKAGIVDNVAYLDALSVKTKALSLYKKSLNDLELAYATYYYDAGKNIEEFIK